MHFSTTVIHLFIHSRVFDPISKTTLTEHLEIDQYIWAILNTLGSTPADDVIIDSEANWKSVPTIGTANIKVSIVFLIISTHHFVCVDILYL